MGHDSLREFQTWGCFESVQLIYTALARKSERALVDAAGAGAGIVARGLLRSYNDPYNNRFEEAGLDELLGGSMSRSEFLFRMVLSNTAVSTAIVGTRSVGHLRDNVRAAELGGLEPGIVVEAKRRLDALGYGLAE